MKIVHITPHLGGGVGRVLLAWLSRAKEVSTDEHVLYCLEDANPTARTQAQSIPISLHDNMAGSSVLGKAAADSDIVLVHWWNHPLLYDLLVNQGLPECRCALWSHVSGFAPPQIITPALIHFPHRFVVATPYSLQVPAIESADAALRKERVRVVFTCAGTEQAAAVRPEPHKGFVVGYVGTVDYCKLHPNFLSMSSAAHIPDLRFVVCGGPSEKQLEHEASALPESPRFEFTGLVNDIPSRLGTFDVFGYPLRNDHYGTGEQALIEAMAAGLPVVVFDNGCERHLVENGKTGLVVSSEEEYAAALELLYKDPEKCRELGRNARKYALSHFSLDAMVRQWRGVFEDLLGDAKQPCSWPNAGSAKGAVLFLESLGESGNIFRDSMNCHGDVKGRNADEKIAELDGAFRSQTRGSPFHYRNHFPQDKWLDYWCNLLESSIAASRPQITMSKGQPS